jgi:hypothetical protein
VRDAVNTAQETRCSALEYAVDEWWSLHFGASPIKPTNGGAARRARSLLDLVDPIRARRSRPNCTRKLTYHHLTYHPPWHLVESFESKYRSYPLGSTWKSYAEPRSRVAVRCIFCFHSENKALSIAFRTPNSGLSGIDSERIPI